MSGSDPLPSWSEGNAKFSIINFATRVSTAGSSDYVPVNERIAVFDNDDDLPAYAGGARVSSLARFCNFHRFGRWCGVYASVCRRGLRCASTPGHRLASSPMTVST